MAKLRFVPNQQGIYDLFYGYDGPVQMYLERLAKDVEAVARQLAPVGETKIAYSGAVTHIGGQLQKSIHAVRIPGGRHAVMALTPYAYFVHEGTRPHEIRPVRGQYLRWEEPDGEVVFAKRVQHPGTDPNPFLLEALRRIIH